MRGLGVLLILLWVSLGGPQAAAARTPTRLTFTGAATAGAYGRALSYNDASVAPRVAFAGDLVTVTIVLDGDPADPGRVDFLAAWSRLPNPSPFITRQSGTAYPASAPAYDGPALVVDMTRTSTGGSLTILPSADYVIGTDGVFSLTLDFTYVRPPDPGGVARITGQGRIYDLQTGVTCGRIGPCDSRSSVPFTLSSLSQSAVPEPNAWAMMVAGSAVAGGLSRRARRRRAAGRVARGHGGGSRAARL